MGEWGKRLYEEVILDNNYVKGRLPDPKKRLPVFIPVILFQILGCLCIHIHSSRLLGFNPIRLISKSVVHSLTVFCFY